MHSRNTAVEVSIGVIDKTRMRSHGKNSFLQIYTVGMLTVICILLRIWLLGSNNYREDSLVKQRINQMENFNNINCWASPNLQCYALNAFAK